jgi:hypothetical protein
MDPIEILNSENPKKISPLLHLYFLFQNDEIIEKAIQICYDKVDDSIFQKLYLNAIYNDLDNVFKIMDKLKYSYNIKDCLKYAESIQSLKCINYFKSR